MLKKTIVHSLPIEASELIISPSGTIYHLDLLPNQIAENIIVVGDQNRVEKISRHFNTIEHKVANREFVTHTGTYKNKRITALSTGIGCDNIDIVINELDALVNIDLKTRLPKKEHTSLNIIRLGTSGALQKDIEIDSFVVSSYGLGFDGLMGFYDCDYEADEITLKNAFLDSVNWPVTANSPYFVKGNINLLNRIGYDMIEGLTATANGFYGPQGRSLRVAAILPTLNEELNQFTFKGKKITNFEMETSALYGLSASLGHKAITVCAIIANRFSKTYSNDYSIPVNELIIKVLDRI